MPEVVRPLVLARPRFQRRVNPNYRGPDRLLTHRTVDAHYLSRLEPIEPFASFERDSHGPFYEDGSVTVRFDHDVPHHDPVTTETFNVFAHDSGAYDVTWAVNARNLPTPATGTLQLVVEDTDPKPTRVATLEALLALAPDADDAD